MDLLPYPLRLKWCELVDTIMQKEARDPNLKDITDFVEARFKVDRADPADTKTATGQKGMQDHSQWKVSQSHPIRHQAIQRRKY